MSSTWSAGSACSLQGLRGDPVAADLDVRPGYEALKTIGEKSHFSALAQVLARAVYLQGRYDEAEQLTRECEEAARPNNVEAQILWRSTRAKVLARRGELEAAEQLGEEAVTIAAESGFSVHPCRSFDGSCRGTAARWSS